jgi:hypothetical protein
MDLESESLEDRLRRLHWDQAMSLHRIADLLGMNRRSLIRTMIRLGVPRRSYAEAMLLLAHPPPLIKEDLSEMYLARRMSCSRISLELGVSTGTITKLLEEYSIPKRSISDANRKYAYHPFEGDKLQAAYLLGFRTGDLHAAVSGSEIRVSTTSTHAAMGRLFDALFSKYAHVGKTPSLGKGRYQWAHYCYLDHSFGFLLRKPRYVPADILENTELFLAFLTGYLDAEGSYRIYQQEETAAFSLRVNSEDEDILRNLAMGLRRMGYHVYFKLAVRHSEDARFRRDVWTLGMFRKDEITDLAKKLKHVHDEKIRWQSLILRSPKSTWREISPYVMQLQDDIVKETAEYVFFAKSSYEYAHEGGLCFDDNSLTNSTARS